jgi:uncharacterized RmlC-like cupin family protein
MSKHNIFSSLRLRQVINDLKRRPEDASKDLKISQSTFNLYLKGKKKLDESFVKKAIKVWPVNIGDFINSNYHKSNSYKIMRVKDSKKTSRVMKRGGLNYYEYRDTVMDRDSPFRPEWIRELIYVKTNSPNEKNLMWNKGHLLHQLTYFVGKINFYYTDKNNKKHTAIMNTGDSMYIAPYVPHTFASREKKCEGHIIAVTFSDKISTNIQNEVAKLSKKKIKEIIFSKKITNYNKVTIKKFKLLKKNNLKTSIKFHELARNGIIPTTRFLRADVLQNNTLNFLNNFHQYIYILSDKAKLKIEKKLVKFKKGDTIYLKPFINYKIPYKETKILIVQVQSAFNKETIEQLYCIGSKNFSRLVKDNEQWFKK